MLSSPLSGIVLAGGASRRLGRDKARLTLLDGRPLIQSVVEKLALVSNEVVVVSDRAERYADLKLGARLICDRVPGQGPLGGIQAGLRAIRSEYALVVGCDMPFLNPDLLTFMKEFYRHYQALVPVWSGKLQPLHAIYARTCLLAIDEMLSKRDQQLQRLLPRVWLRPLEREEWRPYDPLGLSFFNLNGPRDLVLAQSMWRNMGDSLKVHSL